MGGGVDQQGIAIGLCFRDGVGTDRSPCTDTVLDDDGLSDLLGNLIEDAARDDVGGAARTERNDRLDGLLGGPLLANGDGRHEE